MSSVNFPVQIKTNKYLIPKIEVYYPKVELDDRLVKQKINKTIYRLLNNLILKQGKYEDIVEMLGYYEIKTNQRNLLSLSLINYAYTGGAHGMTYIKSLTFDTKNGNDYSLKALFKPNADYVKRLSAIIKKQILERKIDLLGEFKGIKPNQDFYLADKSLVIYFQLYEITPYAYGLQYFPISVYELQDLIVEEGPLGQMLY